MAARSFTAADVARACGVSDQQVSLVLKGRTRSRRVEAYIARRCKVPVKDLFPRQGPLEGTVDAAAPSRE